jgi:hypothetical protein
VHFSSRAWRITIDHPKQLRHGFQVQSNRIRIHLIPASAACRDDIEATKQSKVIVLQRLQHQETIHVDAISHPHAKRTRQSRTDDYSRIME